MPVLIETSCRAAADAKVCPPSNTPGLSPLRRAEWSEHGHPYVARAAHMGRYLESLIERVG